MERVRFDRLTILGLVVVIIIFSASSCFNLHKGVTSNYPGYGRDTLFIIGNGKFQIGETDGIIALEIFPPKSSQLGGAFEMLLTNLTPQNYKEIRGILYVASSTDGFAVINSETNICRILIYDDAIANQYYQWPELKNDPSIIYLTSFEDFTTGEQEILKKLVK